MHPPGGVTHYPILTVQFDPDHRRIHQLSVEVCCLDVGTVDSVHHVLKESRMGRFIQTFDWLCERYLY